MTAAAGLESVREIVEAVLALARAGELDRAEQLCREHLARLPDDVNLVAVLGAVLLGRGDHAQGRQFLERAIEMEPGFAKPHEDLGALHLATGRPAEAVAAFEAAVRLAPRAASAFYGLATALDRAGRREEAERARARFLALSPGGKTLAEAARQRLAGQADRAEQLCGEVLAEEPRNVHALRLLARICADTHRDAAAEGLLRRVLSIAPDLAVAHTDLAWFFLERSRFQEAIPLLRQAVTLRPDAADLHLALADVLSVVGRSAEALCAYERVLELQPDDARALLGHGHMQRIHGRREEAIAAYRRCTALHPGIGEAWWSLATFRGFAFTPAEREELRRQLAQAEPGSDAAIAMGFALARVCEAQGDYAQAWAHYEKGNAAKRRTVAYDPVAAEAQHDACIRVFDRRLVEQARGTVDGRGARPIFITGVPRSGSTLIEQILSCHPEVEACGELPYVIMLSAGLGKGRPGSPQYPEAAASLSAEEWRALGDEYLKHTLAHRNGASRCFTDKMPANFGHLGFIRMMLPEAVFIDARRNPLDTCVANYRQLYAQGKNQSYDLAELGEYYLEYLRMMRHWESVMPGEILTVHYEDVVHNLEAQVRRLLAHCGLEFDARCLRFHESTRSVNTASSEQVRDPIYADAVGYWQHYASHLDTLREILAPILP